MKNGTALSKKIMQEKDNYREAPQVVIDAVVNVNVVQQRVISQLKLPRQMRQRKVLVPLSTPSCSHAGCRFGNMIR